MPPAWGRHTAREGEGGSHFYET
ncbi:hypothetical protein YPPY15_2220, partial [Yersinia pestis PY-15]